MKGVEPKSPPWLLLDPLPPPSADGGGLPVAPAMILTCRRRKAPFGGKLALAELTARVERLEPTKPIIGQEQIDQIIGAELSDLAAPVGAGDERVTASTDLLAEAEVALGEFRKAIE